MAHVSIHGAGQVLRPPEDGLPYLRHDHGADLTLWPGGVTIRGGRIAALEADARAPVQIDAGGGAVVPGFVDCHTHLPFAGWGAAERPAGDGAVLRQTRGVAAEMLREGTTTFECRASSIHGLRLAARVAEGVDQCVVATAAVGPDELPQALTETRARAAAVAEADVRAHGRAVTAHDLWLRVDAEEAVVGPLALGARSIDGLSELRPGDLAALAAAECAAVLLPAAELLGAEHLAPGRALADAGAICAVATGCHPLRAPVAAMALVLGLAGRFYGWEAREALLACTLNAAWVLGVSGDTGSLEPGKRADVLILDCPVEHVVLRLGRNPVAVVICDGEIAWVRPDQAWRVSGA